MESESPISLKDILFQDDYLVALNKPNGLLVHRTKIAEENRWFANQALAALCGQPVFPVHRLDRATSGVLLFAFSSSIAAQLQKGFTSGTTTKEYLAIVRGYVKENGLIDEGLINHESGKLQKAITKFERLNLIELPLAVNKYPTSRYSLVKMIPQTGRTHQLRRHFNHLAHPIVGDTKYGDLRHNRMFAEQFGINQLLLHANGLTFYHPESGELTKITAPLPGPFARLLNEFGWKI